MAAIRGKNTKPEIWLRKELFRLGFRYRLHRKDLPGKPDIVLPKHKALIFVHGCFWHGHQGCPLFKVPSSRTDFWLNKINTNKARDNINTQKLLAEGWRVLEVWECALKGKERWDLKELAEGTSKWIIEGSSTGSITGKKQAN